MGGGSLSRNKGEEQSTAIARWTPVPNAEADMPEDREKISSGPDEEPVNETIAGTGPGIPDDALAPGEELPEPPSDKEVEQAAQQLDAPVGKRERDTLPLEGE